MLSMLKRLFAPVNKPLMRPKSQIETALEQVDQINPYAFHRVHSSDFSIFMLNVLIVSVKNYTETLTKATQAIETDVGLFKHEFQFELSRIPIGDFFLTNNRNYLDEIEEVKLFIDAARLFLKAYQKISDDERCSINNTHNRRVLRFILKNLIEIIDRFIWVR